MLFEALAALAVAGGLLGVVAARRSERRYRDQRLRVVEACGLQDVSVQRDVVTARDGALTVEIRIGRERGGACAVVVVGGLVPTLRLERTSLGGRFWEAVGAADIEVGDPAFDADFTVGSSDPALVYALLDDATRARLREVFEAGYPLTIERGRLTAVLLKHVGSTDRFTHETVRALIDVARRLQAPASREALLAATARNAALGAVRLKALQALLASVEHPETRAALRAALRDTEPEIRLLAARTVGPEADPVLRELVVGALVPDAVSAQAMDALGARLTLATARGVLERAVSDRVLSGTAALRVVAAGGASEVTIVASVLGRTQGRLAMAATEALASIGGTAAEPPLVAALRASETAVAAAAARALARCGSLAAIPALRDAERRGVDVEPAARTAVAAIQSRLPGASPGQISLAGDEAGQLSVAERTEGRVSLDDD